MATSYFLNYKQLERHLAILTGNPVFVYFTNTEYLQHANHCSMLGTHWKRCTGPLSLVSFRSSTSVFGDTPSPHTPKPDSSLSTKVRMSGQLPHPSKGNLHCSGNSVMQLFLAGTWWLTPLVPVQQMMWILILTLISWADIHYVATQAVSGS